MLSSRVHATRTPLVGTAVSPPQVPPLPSLGRCPRMPNGQPSQLANLRPQFERGNTISRLHKGRLRGVTRACHAAPECVEYALSVMRDAEEPTKIRLAACKTVLDLAIPPPKSSSDFETTGAQLKFLEVVFIRPGEEQLEAQAKGNGHFAVTFDAGD